MIYEEKIVGDEFSSICSENKSSDVFSKARHEILDTLKENNFNVKESSALLKQINEYIIQKSNDLIYSQDLKNLF